MFNTKELKRIRTLTMNEIIYIEDELEDEDIDKPFAKDLKKDLRLCNGIVKKIDSILEN